MFFESQTIDDNEKNEKMPLLSEPPLPTIMQPRTIEEISQGTLIGCGKYGVVYRIGSSAYKIYFDDDLDYDPAARSARYWNDVYRGIYDGKYHFFATAKSEKMPAKNGKTQSVLVTPFIVGKGLNFLKSWEYSRIKNELKKLNFEMVDLSGTGNVLLHDGDPLPVDFDQVIQAPIQTSCCFYRYYPESTSPVSKRLILREEGDSCVQFTARK